MAYLSPVAVRGGAIRALSGKPIPAAADGPGGVRADEALNSSGGSRASPKVLVKGAATYGGVVKGTAAPPRHRGGQGGPVGSGPFSSPPLGGSPHCLTATAGTTPPGGVAIRGAIIRGAVIVRPDAVEAQATQAARGAPAGGATTRRPATSPTTEGPSGVGVGPGGPRLRGASARQDGRGATIIGAPLMPTAARFTQGPPRRGEIGPGP